MKTTFQDIQEKLSEYESKRYTIKFDSESEARGVQIKVDEPTKTVVVLGINGDYESFKCTKFGK